MKVLGHPVHMMLVHFPAALFPMDLVLSFLHYFKGEASFGSASYYCLMGGVIMGWTAAVFGAVDLLRIKTERALVQRQGFIHGSVNVTVLLAYTVMVFILQRDFPDIEKPTLVALVVRSLLVILLLIGNFIGGNLVLKHKVGVHI